MAWNARFRETHARHLHFSIFSNQIISRNIGNPVFVRRRVALFVQQRPKRNPVLCAELSGIRRIILRNRHEAHAIAPACPSITLKKPLEERKRKLANRAGNLEESCNHRSARERCAQRKAFSFGIYQLKEWRWLSRLYGLPRGPAHKR